AESPGTTEGKTGALESAPVLRWQSLWGSACVDRALVEGGIPTCGQRTVGALNLVLDLDLREVDAELVGGDDVAAAAAAGLVGRHQAIGQGDLVEVPLGATGLAA